MIPPLPGELIDLIVDFLANDPRTLQQCSVVNRRWTDATRRYIFQTITLKFQRKKLRRQVCQRKLDALTQCFINNPQTASSVRTITLQLITSQLDEFPHVQEKLSLFLSHLSNLHHCVLWNIQWSVTTPELRHAIHQLFNRSPLCRLSTDRLMIGKSDAIELLKCARTIEQLDVGGTQVSPESPGNTVNKGVELHGLKLLRLPGKGVRNMYPGILPATPNFTSLSELVISSHSSNESDLKVIAEILRIPMISLQRLQLHELPAGLDSIRIPSQLTDLILSDCHVPTLSRIIERVDDPILLKRLKITINVYALDQIPMSSFKFLDTALAKAELSNLKDVTVCISSWDSPPRGLLKSEQLFPVLSHSGRVNIDVSHLHMYPH